jgi:hypothetical protein
MSTDRDVDRIVRSWLEVGATALPDRVLDQVLDQLPATSQRRAWWPARRFHEMNSAWKFAIAAAAIVVVAVVGFSLLPKQPAIGVPAPSPTPTRAPFPSAFPGILRDGAVPAGTYVTQPFAQAGSGACFDPPQSGCAETTTDDSVRIAYTVPDGWAGIAGTDFVLAAGGNLAPDGAGIGVSRGGWLHSEPCRTDPAGPDMPVGLTVDDFATALADHPLLDVTTPVDVTLDGYAGKYVDLQVPLDISACDAYFPWEPGIWAQGPGHRWHLWILDVEGTRVIVQSTDYAATSAQHRAELQAIVDSIRIQR